MQTQITNQTYKVTQYSPEFKKHWDNFIDTATNAHFMFKRDYMEYHADRFQDFSLMIYENENLIAILPANKKADSLYSHQGLTFGGLIVNKNIKAVKAIEIFKSLQNFLKKQDLTKLIYKAMPFCYHKNIYGEDVYALALLEAKIIQTQINSVIDISNQLGFSKGKKQSVKKAQSHNLSVELSEDYQKFFTIMEELLEDKYAAKPVHSLAEMQNLHSKFPNNIKLYFCKSQGKTLAGTIIYETDTVAKTQYICSTIEGRDLGAVDYLMDYLINQEFQKKKFFDFGTSVANTDTGFNENLIMQKELFGARAITMSIYEMEI